MGDWHNKDQLISYLATLFALVFVYVASLIAAKAGVTIGEAFGLGAITGGLIGVLRSPSNRSVTVDNPPSDPLPVQDTSDNARN